MRLVSQTDPPLPYYRGLSCLSNHCLPLFFIPLRPLIWNSYSPSFLNAASGKSDALASSISLLPPEPFPVNMDSKKMTTIGPLFQRMKCSPLKSVSFTFNSFFRLSLVCLFLLIYDVISCDLWACKQMYLLGFSGWMQLYCDWNIFFFPFLNCRANVKSTPPEKREQYL